MDFVAELAKIPGTHRILSKALAAPWRLPLPAPYGNLPKALAASATADTRQLPKALAASATGAY